MVARPLRFAVTVRARWATGSGSRTGGVAEVEMYFVDADLDVLGGQPVDRRGPLGVKEEKQSCEAGGRRNGGVGYWNCPNA